MKKSKEGRPLRYIKIPPQSRREKEALANHQKQLQDQEELREKMKHQDRQCHLLNLQLDQEKLRQDSRRAKEREMLTQRRFVEAENEKMQEMLQQEHHQHNIKIRVELAKKWEALCKSDLPGLDLDDGDRQKLKEQDQQWELINLRFERDKLREDIASLNMTKLKLGEKEQSQDPPLRIPVIDEKVPQAKDKESKEESRGECSVCLDAQANAVSILCGHLSVCYACSKSLTKCPICQASTTFIKVFFAR